jgi:hypothetical protein
MISLPQSRYIEETVVPEGEINRVQPESVESASNSGTTLVRNCVVREKVLLAIMPSRVEFRMVPLTDFRHVVRQPTGWFAVVLFLSVIALAANVATRTSVPTLSHGTSIESQASPSVRQHMDSDGVEWVPPVAPVAIFEAVSFYPRISPAGPPIPSLFFETTLYNRPPPSC